MSYRALILRSLRYSVKLSRFICSNFIGFGVLNPNSFKIMTSCSGELV